MGSRFLKKNCKSLKPEPLNLRLLEEAEEDDNVDLLLNRRREIVKVCLTGLGDIEGKEDIAVLDRVNKFLLTPETAPVNTQQKSLTFDSEICTQGENGRNNLKKSQLNDSVKDVKDQTPKNSVRAKKPGKAESTKYDQGKHEKDGNPEDRSKGFCLSLGHCPHRVIYVKEALDKLDTLHMAPTMVVKFTEDADHFKEHHNIDAFNWRRDVIPVCVSDDENSEVFDFHVTAGSNKLSQRGYKLVDPSLLMGCSPVSDSVSSSSDSSQSKNTKYVVIQGEKNQLTPMPQAVSNKQKARTNGSRGIKKVCFSGEEDSVPYKKDFDRMLHKNGRVLMLRITKFFAQMDIADAHSSKS